MSHAIGVSNSYYKPTEKELLEDYLKAISVLSINQNNNNNAIIEKEVKELKEKNENNEYIIQSKLQERDDAISSLSESSVYINERDSRPEKNQDDSLIILQPSSISFFD